MKKIKIDYKLPETVKISVGENTTVQVSPLLDAGTQAGLIAQYTKDLFNTDNVNLVEGVEKRRFNAELSQMLYILGSNTNIDVTSLNENTFFDSKLWLDIRNAISNYDEFRIRQYEIVADYEDQKDKAISIEVVLSGLIEKLSTFINSLAELTPESIATLQENSKSLLEQLENSKVVQDMERGEK